MKSLRYITLIILIIFSQQLAAGEIKEHTKLWGTAVITGPFCKNSNIRFYLEPQLRFIDNRYKFEESFFYAGLGYAITPDFIFFIGDAEVASKNSSTGDVVNQNRIWQQASWIPIKQSSINVLSRTRFEERKNYSESQWAFRIRERILGRLPFRSDPTHSLVVFDEVFLDLNHPKWIPTNSFLSQNRAFIGLGTVLSKKTTLDIGYLNQYQFTQPNQMSHILLFMWNINS